MATSRLAANLTLGAVELTVASLDRSLARRPAGTARCGPSPGLKPGLSHFAPQVPTPADLARFVNGR
jgi:hypothetical protein